MLVVVLITVGWVIVAGLFSLLAGAGVRLSARGVHVRPLAADERRRGVGAGDVQLRRLQPGLQHRRRDRESADVTIPRSIVLSTFIVAALYMLMTIVILGMMPWQEVQRVAHRSRRCSSSGPSRIRRTGRIAGIVMTGLILFVAAASLYATILGYSRDSLRGGARRRFLQGLRARASDQGLSGRVAASRSRSSRSRSASSRWVSWSAG